MSPIQAGFRRSVIAVGALLAILVMSGCSTEDPPSRGSAHSPRAEGDSVAGAWARVQATEYGGCPKGSCKDYLLNLIQQLESLNEVMAATDGEKFAEPIEIMQEIPDSSIGDIDSKKESILDMRTQLKSWFSRHPKEAKGLSY
ncbi:hypothetical protein ACFY5H_33545 [Streptomyces sp. NPDC013012]|uniref:hypothetical protein n=1 Tax=Streptomyces sp. NPDC013012 TaxID=3364860 RepID=UPI0036921F0F